MKSEAILFIVFACSTSFFGQTSLEIEKKYGRPVGPYAVSESILMTPDFTPEGEVCQMRLFAKRPSPSSILANQVSQVELKGVLRQLVPAGTEGAQRAPFSRSVTGGGAVWTTYYYEKVTLVFSAPLIITPDSSKESSSYNFSPEAITAYNLTPSIAETADLFSGDLPVSEIVTIRWNGRKCIAR